MANQDFSSDNIDDYLDFDFARLGDDLIEVSEQKRRSFPLSYIRQKDGFLHIEVYYEVYMWDHWIRNYSIKKLERSYYNVFAALQIEGVEDITPGVFNEVDDYILLTWNLKIPLTRWQSEIKTAILKSVDIVLYSTRLQLEENRPPRGISRYFLINGNSYTISSGIFWVALPLICSCAFFLGTVKYDADKIHLSKEKIALEDAAKNRDITINKMRHNSDSALDILGHMPYKQMTLDSQSFKKVQTTIENAGAVLYLNK